MAVHALLDAPHDPQHPARELHLLLEELLVGHGHFVKAEHYGKLHFEAQLGVDAGVVTHATLQSDSLAQEPLLAGVSTEV